MLLPAQYAPPHNRPITMACTQSISNPPSEILTRKIWPRIKKAIEYPFPVCRVVWLFDADPKIKGYRLRPSVDYLDHVIAGLPELPLIRCVR